MGSEHRQRPRRNTPHHVRVIDDQSGRVLGRIVDVTADGMMLVSPRLIAPGSVFLVRITLPVMVQDRSEVVVEARAVWCTQDTNPAFHKVGFAFANLPGEEGFMLEDVMHRLNLVG